MLLIFMPLFFKIITQISSTKKRAKARSFLFWVLTFNRT